MSAQHIYVWEQDPGSPDRPNTPVRRDDDPDLATKPLSVEIRGPEIGPGPYDEGTPEFRYWAAADALDRARDVWRGFLPEDEWWYPTVPDTLPVDLDRGEGDFFTAAYDRDGIAFAHGTVGGRVVYPGESPDVVCHELGHAILDAIRPRIWDAGFIETSAFHESFGDITALLAALRLASVREKVLDETDNKLYRTSSLSRFAEQLGWAVRQRRPDLAEADCFRNAVNSFFYTRPESLPSVAHATQLSSEPHSFSRVFTGAFLQALAAMLSQRGQPDPDTLDDVARDAAELLVKAVRTVPLSPDFLSQVAAHMLAAAREQGYEHYQNALKAAFAEHGLLPVETAASIAAGSQAERLQDPGPAAARLEPALPQMEFAGSRYGLGAELYVDVPTPSMLFAVAGAAPSWGGLRPGTSEHAAASYVEDVFRRGRVEFGEDVDEYQGTCLVSPMGRKTHRLERHEGKAGLYLRRLFFDCGLGEID